VSSKLKPILTFVIFSEFQMQPTVGDTIINPAQNLRLPYIPTAYSFMMSIGLQGYDKSIENSLKAIFKDPSGKILLDSSPAIIPKYVSENQSTVPNEYSCVSVNFNLQNILFTEEGVYTVTLLLNDEIIESKGVYVFKHT